MEVSGLLILEETCFSRGSGFFCPLDVAYLYLLEVLWACLFLALASSILVGILFGPLKSPLLVARPRVTNLTGNVDAIAVAVATGNAPWMKVIIAHHVTALFTMIVICAFYLKFLCSVFVFYPLILPRLTCFPAHSSASAMRRQS